MATISYSTSPFCRTITTPQTVTQTGVAGGNYSAIPAGLSINTLTGAITPSLSVAGTYTVNYTIFANGGCPNVVNTTTVTVTASQVANFVYNSATYCQNGLNPVLIYTGGGIAGVFTSTTGLSLSTTTGAINLSLSSPGLYTITNTLAGTGGCPASVATFNITITAPPAATFSYPASPYCSNSTNPTPVYSGGGVAGTFSSTPTGLSLNTTTGEINIVGSTAGTYTVTNLILGTGGCANVFATSTVTINPNPIATIASNDADNTICSNETATITVTPTNFIAANATYVWSLNGTIIPGTTNIITPTASGTYSVVVNLNGCTNVNPLTLLFTVNTKPNFTLTATNLVKCANEVAVISVNPSNFVVTNPTFTYAWTLDGISLPNTTSTINVTAYGNYAVTVSNFGCSTSAQTDVTLDTTNIPINTVGECAGINYIITATPISGSFNNQNVDYQWFFNSDVITGNNQSTLNVTQYIAQNNVSTASLPLNFTVKITTKPEGCVDEQVFSVINPFCVIQKGISPNGDGNNDSFDLKGLGVKMLSIFNRYGTKVYGLANYKDQWKGQTDNGKDLPDGTYYFVIDQNSGETKSGWIYINR